MDDITTRAIVVGVNVFVTLAILSIIIIMFSHMGEIYGMVATTDNSIASTFDSIYDMYNGRTMTGLGMLNTVKKYESNTDKNVIVSYPDSEIIKDHVEKNEGLRESVYLKELMEKNQGYKYETKYNVSVENIDDTTIRITFIER